MWSPEPGLRSTGLHEFDRQHSRVDEGVTVGSCRINHLLFADELVLLASSQQSSAMVVGRGGSDGSRPPWLLKISEKKVDF